MNKTLKIVKVESLEHLKELCNYYTWREFFISLNGGLISRKLIRYSAKNGRFMIENLIDGSTQFLTSRQIMDKEYTNIGNAITNKCLFMEE